MTAKLTATVEYRRAFFQAVARQEKIWIALACYVGIPIVAYIFAMVMYGRRIS
jgi:hypothetical protein